MAKLPVPWVQLGMMMLLIRKNRTCEIAWTRAGYTRRLTTLLWGCWFLMEYGTLGKPESPNGITDNDIFPQGIDNIQREDVVRMQSKIEEWFDYWSSLHPNDTLEKAMLNLIARLMRCKRGWLSERSDRFPVGEAISRVVTPEFEVYMQGEKV
jgi:hypothetical protein